jgi:uncharacterized membrane protein
LYVGGSVVGFMLVATGVPFADIVQVYEPPVWGRRVTVTLMPLAFVMLTALLLPTNIKRITRHPMLWSFAIWSVAHLLANGDLASILLFGSFGAYSVFSMWSLTRRGAQKSTQRYSPAWDVLVILIGIVVYIAVVYLHTFLFGVPAIL